MKPLLLITVSLTLTGCCSFDQHNSSTLAEGAARLYFHSAYTNHYEANRNTSLSFDDYRIDTLNLNIDGIPFNQFTYTYTGTEELDTNAQQYSIFVAPTELDAVWSTPGKPFE